MNLKKIVSKTIALFMATTILFGNFSMCGIGISKVIAENSSAPEIEIQIENQKYVQYSYTDHAEKEVAGVAVQSKLSVRPIQVAETYLSTQSVNLSVNMPRINEYLPVRATVVTASTEYTTGEESKNINQSYDATTGLLNVSYENTLDEEGNIYANFNENAKDEFEIIYIYPAEAYVGNETDTALNYTVYAEVIFVTENGTVESIANQTIELIEKDNKGDIENFIVTELKGNAIYKGFMYLNIQNKTSYDTEFTTVSTFAVLNNDIAKEAVVEENANQLILNGEEVVVSANENIVYNSTTILKFEFDKILGQENSFVEFYQDEEIYAIVRYVDIDENKKMSITYKDAETIILEDGTNEVVVNYPENTTNLKIKISKPIAEGFINFENKNRIKASEDYGYAVEDIKSILVTTSINENIKETELKLSEPSTKVSINSSNVNFSTLQQSSTTLTINLDDTNITTKLFNAPTLTIKLPEGIEKFDVKNVAIVNGNGLTVAGHEIVDNTIVIHLAGEQTDFDFNNVSGGVNIVVDIENIDYSDIIPTHSDKIELTCSQDNIKEECNVNIVSKPGLLTLSNFSGYDNNGNVITNIDNTLKVAQVAVKEEAKEALFTLDLVNNYDENLTNVQILGKIGYSNNDLSSTFETIITRPIEINNEGAKVYYSTNIDAGYDDDSWQEEYTNQAKLYKVVLANNELAVGSHVSLKEYIQIPENLNVNEASFLNVNVIYNYNDIVMEDNLIMGMETVKDELYLNYNSEEIKLLNEDGEELLLNLSIVPLISQDYVHSGQTVTYKIEVQNNSEEDLNNITVTDYIPDNAIYTYIEEREGTVANYNEIIKDEQIKTKTWTIEKLQAKETKELEIMLTMGNVESVQDIINTVEIRHNEQNRNEQSKVTLKPAEIHTELSFKDSEHIEVEFAENTIVEYYIDVKNVTETTKRNIKVEYRIPQHLEYVGGGLGIYDEFDGYSIGEEGTINNNIFEYNISQLRANEEKRIVVRCKVQRLQESYEAKIQSIASIYLQEEVYQTNVKEIHTTQTGVNISLESNIEEETILKKDDQVVYTIKVRNIGRRDCFVEVRDNVPSEIIVEKVEYRIDDGEIRTTLGGVQNITISSALNTSQLLTIKITGKVAKIEGDSEEIISLNNIAKVILGDEEISSNEIIVKVDPKLGLEEEQQPGGDVDTGEEYNPDEIPTLPEDMEENLGDETPDTGNDGNPDQGQDPNPDLRPEPEQPEGNNPQEPTPDTPINKYLISGKTWLDLNKNGQKDPDEKVMENIQVSLVDKATGKFALDEAGNRITVTTNLNGEYKFESVKEGTYVVVFEFDTNKYVVTTYQKTNVDQDINSDAILTKLNIEGQDKLAGMTDTIELKSDKVNIDIGLMENAIFDLSLEKVITKVTVINAKGAETTEYKDGETVKVDLVAKYMNGAEVIVTYKFTIKNEGDTVGYVDKLVDNLPSGLEFSSELNSNWYKGSDNQLYTTSLSGKAIKPGETLDVELVLTKKMTEDNTGVFPNNAELVEISNLQNIKEKEDALENNKSSAMLIISIKTGSVVLYTGITLTSILIIAAGAYIIKKKILNRGI